MQPFGCVYYRGESDKIFKALTCGELTKQYWYNRRIESDWKVGSPVRFFDGDSRALTDSGFALESDPRLRSSELKLAS